MCFFLLHSTLFLLYQHFTVKFLINNNKEKRHRIAFKIRKTKS
jgi:hypothetical protein